MLDPFATTIVRLLKDKAHENADKTISGVYGYAGIGNISVRYSPICNQFRWFWFKQPITKQEAIERLRITS